MAEVMVPLCFQYVFQRCQTHYARRHLFSVTRKLYFPCARRGSRAPHMEKYLLASKNGFVPESSCLSVPLLGRSSSSNTSTNGVLPKIRYKEHTFPGNPLSGGPLGPFLGVITSCVRVSSCQTRKVMFFTEVLYFFIWK